MPRTPPSLLSRAVGFLARREHSRVELARKLARHTDDTHEIDRVLRELQEKNLLSDARFVSSHVHRRAPGKGTAWVMQELRQHQVPPEALEAARAELQQTELVRAVEAWQKRFGSAPHDLKEQAKQMRFLAARGFSAAVVRQVVPQTVSASGHVDHEPMSHDPNEL